MKKICARSRSDQKRLPAFLSILAFAALALLPRNAAAAAAPADLAAWWQAEGNGKDSAGGNQAALLNGLRFTKGKTGRAFAFDGVDDAAIAPDAASLNFSAGQDFSIAAWIRPEVSPTTSGVMNIVDKRFIPPPYPQPFVSVGYALQLFNGQLAFQMSDSTNSFSPFVGAGPDLRDGQFHHVAVTVQRDSTTGGKLYVDGEVVLTFDPTTEPGDLSNGEPLRLGIHADPAFASFFKGAMDEIAIFRRAVAPREIENMFRTGKVQDCGTPPAGMIAWWRGEDEAHDSINGLNGTEETVSYTNGVVGRAFDFDLGLPARGRITIPDAPIFKLTNSLTIEGWIQTVGGYVIFMRGDSRPGRDPYVLSMGNDDVLHFIVNDGADNFAELTVTIPYRQWLHVAGTLDDATGVMRLYTNGVIAAETVTTIRPGGDLLPEWNPMLGIGNVGELSYDFPFNGQIDELSLYDTALSPAAVQAIYQAGAGGKAIALLAAHVSDSGLPDKIRQPLLATLNFAITRFPDRPGLRAPLLRTFQHQVRGRVLRVDPVLADQLINEAQFSICTSGAR